MVLKDFAALDAVVKTWLRLVPAPGGGCCWPTLMEALAAWSDSPKAASKDKLPAAGKRLPDAAPKPQGKRPGLDMPPPLREVPPVACRPEPRPLHQRKTAAMTTRSASHANAPSEIHVDSKPIIPDEARSTAGRGVITRSGRRSNDREWPVVKPEKRPFLESRAGQAVNSTAPVSATLVGVVDNARAASRRPSVPLSSGSEAPKRRRLQHISPSLFEGGDLVLDLVSPETPAWVPFDVDAMRPKATIVETITVDPVSVRPVKAIRSAESIPTKGTEKDVRELSVLKRPIRQCVLKRKKS